MMVPTHFVNRVVSGGDGKHMSFDVHDVSISVINAVRRIIMSNVPTIAFPFDVHDPSAQGVKVLKNTTSLHNEFIGHRISLVPLMFDENTTNDYADAVESHEHLFQFQMRNTTSDMMAVTTEHFQIFNKGVELSTASRASILPMCSLTGHFILLHKLKPNLYNLEDGQELHVECRPVIGTGAMHARWSPVSQCVPSFIVDEVAVERKRTDIQADVESTPKQIAAQLRKFETLDKYRCFHTNAFEEVNRVHFVIESECGLRPDYLVFKALKILHDTLIDFSAACQDPSTIVVSLIGARFFQLKVGVAFFSLINVLQSGIYDRQFRRRHGAEGEIDFVGYPDAHPLEDTMLLKVRFRENREESGVRDFFTGESRGLARDIHRLIVEWIVVSDLQRLDIKEVAGFASYSLSTSK